MGILKDYLTGFEDKAQMCKFTTERMCSLNPSHVFHFLPSHYCGQFIVNVPTKLVYGADTLL